jgi:hypothetical protein
MMASKGFTRTSPDTFTRGTLQVRVGGALYFTDDRRLDWISKADYGSAHYDTVTAMVDLMVDGHR